MRLGFALEAGRPTGGIIFIYDKIQCIYGKIQCIYGKIQCIYWKLLCSLSTVPSDRGEYRSVSSREFWKVENLTKKYQNLTKNYVTFLLIRRATVILGPIWTD